VDFLVEQAFFPNRSEGKTCLIKYPAPNAKIKKVLYKIKIILFKILKTKNSISFGVGFISFLYID